MRKQENEQRPPISQIETGTELKRWYWLKDELIGRARECGLKTTGGKFIILDRLGFFLDTGIMEWPGDVKAATRSKFNWHAAPLNRQTLITDSYKNSQNVRRFFVSQVGNSFKFNIAFMDWMTQAQGKTMGDAVDVYMEQQRVSREPGFKTSIKPHNQFNQYTRDILQANPNISMAEVRQIWEKKRALPSEDGRHVYCISDLDL